MASKTNECIMCTQRGLVKFTMSLQMCELKPMPTCAASAENIIFDSTLTAV